MWLSPVGERRKGGREGGREGEGEGGNTCHLVDGLCCMGYEFCEWLFFPNMVTNNYVYNHK